MTLIAVRLNRIKPSPSSMASQRARELRATGRDIVGLTSGEPDLDIPPNVCEAVVRARRRGSGSKRAAAACASLASRSALIERRGWRS